MVGYEHHVEEARAGATLSRAAAQFDAENFIESKLGIKSDWDLLPEEINSVKARWGEAANLMGAVVFLASRAADYVNGQVLVVDGGYLVR